MFSKQFISACFDVLLESGVTTFYAWKGISRIDYFILKKNKK
jgi:hypothetical protein